MRIIDFVIALKMFGCPSCLDRGALNVDVPGCFMSVVRGPTRHKLESFFLSSDTVVPKGFLFFFPAVF